QSRWPHKGYILSLAYLNADGLEGMDGFTSHPICFSDISGKNECLHGNRCLKPCNARRFEVKQIIAKIDLGQPISIDRHLRKVKYEGLLANMQVEIIRTEICND